MIACSSSRRRIRDGQVKFSTCNLMNFLYDENKKDNDKVKPGLFRSRILFEVRRVPSRRYSAYRLC